MLDLERKKLATLFVLLLLCGIFITCGIIFNDIVDLIIQAKVQGALPLRNGTIAFKFWQQPPVPIKFGIHVFHIANPAEVLAGTEVPVMIEKGPYVYRMHIEKTDIVWHDNDTIEYIQPQKFIFDRSASSGPDNDTFLTINIPYITVATLLQYEFAWLQNTVDAFFNIQGESAFMNRSVYDIWWGYQDPVLEELANIMDKLNRSSPLFNGKFGFFMDRNNTGDGLYNVFSGLNKQFDNYVHIDRWNSVKNLSVWTTDFANEIRGSDGSMQPPFVNANSNLSIFDAYLHRSLKLQYSTTSSCQGIRTLRFYVPYSEFATKEENPDNAGFCTPDCIPSGAYNMSVVSYYAPIYASLPHFVGGDSYYQSQVKGLTPSQVLHQPFYDIQAITGVSMRAARRYQLNIRTQSFQHFKQFKNFPVSYLPILWIDGMAEIDKDTAALLKGMIQDPLDAMPYVRGTVFSIGGIFFIISMSLFLYWRNKSSKALCKYSRLVDDEDSRLNDGAITNDYGTNHSFKNGLNSTPDDYITSNQHPETNNLPTESTNTILPIATSNRSEHISGIENSENETASSKNFNSLEGTLNKDKCHNESRYFDSMTSLSPEHSEKYYSVDEN